MKKIKRLDTKLLEEKHPEENLLPPPPPNFEQGKDWTKCPSGHPLPRQTRDGGECTPIWCADGQQQTNHAARSTPATRMLPKGVDQPNEFEQRELAKDPGAPMNRDPLDYMTEQEQEIRATMIDTNRRASIERGVRNMYLPEPTPEEIGADPDQYVSKRLQDISPIALHDVEYRLKYGDPEQKERAAREWLDMAGWSKSDQKVPNQGPVIIVNLGGEVKGAPPWGQKTIDVKKEGG